VTVAFASVPAPLDPHTLEGVAIVTAMRIADKARAEGRRGDALLFVDNCEVWRVSGAWAWLDDRQSWRRLALDLEGIARTRPPGKRAGRTDETR
jgi:hypothetical protein